MPDREPLERTQELFDLLQGVVPDDCRIPEGEVPRLTPEQAWAVVWYLQNQYYEYPDYVARCDVCGDLFDSRAEGCSVDNGPPWHFCGECDTDKAQGPRKE